VIPVPLTFYKYFDSATNSLEAMYYHFDLLQKAAAYSEAYANAKALIFEAKSALDSLAATMNDLFNLGIADSHVVFNDEFVEKLNSQTTFPEIQNKYPKIVDDSIYEYFISKQSYFRKLRTYLVTSFMFFEVSPNRYLLSDEPGTYSFNLEVEAVRFCESLLQSLKYVFCIFNEVLEDVLLLTRKAEV
jgi:hypothetical protein